MRQRFVSDLLVFSRPAIFLYLLYFMRNDNTILDSELLRTQLTIEITSNYYDGKFTDVATLSVIFMNKITFFSILFC